MIQSILPYLRTALGTFTNTAVFHTVVEHTVVIMILIIMRAEHLCEYEHFEL